APDSVAVRGRADEVAIRQPRTLPDGRIASGSAARAGSRLAARNGGAVAAAAVGRGAGARRPRQLRTPAGAPRHTPPLPAGRRRGGAGCRRRGRVVKLARSLRARRGGIVTALRLRLSDPRLEAMTWTVRLISHRPEASAGSTRCLP